MATLEEKYWAGEAGQSRRQNGPWAAFLAAADSLHRAAPGRLCRGACIDTCGRRFDGRYALCRYKFHPRRGDREPRHGSGWFERCLDEMVHLPCVVQIGRSRIRLAPVLDPWTPYLHSLRTLVERAANRDPPLVHMRGYLARHWAATVLVPANMTDLPPSDCGLLMWKDRPVPAGAGSRGRRRKGHATRSTRMLPCLPATLDVPRITSLAYVRNRINEINRVTLEGHPVSQEIVDEGHFMMGSDGGVHTNRLNDTLGKGTRREKRLMWRVGGVVPLYGRPASAQHTYTMDFFSGEQVVETYDVIYIYLPRLHFLYRSGLAKPPGQRYNPGLGCQQGPADDDDEYKGTDNDEDNVHQASAPSPLPGAPPPASPPPFTLLAEIRPSPAGQAASYSDAALRAAGSWFQSLGLAWVPLAYRQAPENIPVRYIEVCGRWLPTYDGTTGLVGLPSSGLPAELGARGDEGDLLLVRPDPAGGGFRVVRAGLKIPTCYPLIAVPDVSEARQTFDDVLVGKDGLRFGPDRDLFVPRTVARMAEDASCIALLAERRRMVLPTTSGEVDFEDRPAFQWSLEVGRLLPFQTSQSASLPQIIDWHDREQQVPYPQPGGPLLVPVGASPQDRQRAEAARGQLVQVFGTIVKRDDASARLYPHASSIPAWKHLLGHREDENQCVLYRDKCKTCLSTMYEDAAGWHHDPSIYRSRVNGARKTRFDEIFAGLELFRAWFLAKFPGRYVPDFIDSPVPNEVEERAIPPALVDYYLRFWARTHGDPVVLPVPPRRENGRWGGLTAMGALHEPYNPPARRRGEEEEEEEEEERYGTSHCPKCLGRR